jgi:plasmid stabilization system protein ParE
VKITILRAARAEVHEAAAWYAVNADADVRARWLAAVDATLARVAEMPLAYALVRGHRRARRAPVHNFPYRVVFYVTEESAARVRVIAFEHTRREPGYWLDRL